ncbi:unnamed protein product [Rangifer tarandus platyrhynchus]|uniref:Uncharacterized protein n=1 Tax=Rangifer tarandus platyrhynchus TaxID=3082113 RepID=A0ABN8XWY6_RANTA|nr:unnamed protein product [Rangifer tarandus platyrhynchus]
MSATGGARPRPRETALAGLTNVRPGDPGFVVSRRAAGPCVSELQDPQTFCGWGDLHFWPERLRGEPKAASNPRGPAGQGGSEQVGRGQRSPGCERLRLGPVLRASSLGLGQRRGECGAAKLLGLPPWPGKLQTRLGEVSGQQWDPERLPTLTVPSLREQRRDWVQRLVDDWPRGALLTAEPHGTFLGAVCFFLSLPRAQNVAQATRPLASLSLPPRPRERAVPWEMPGARLPRSLLPETPCTRPPPGHPFSQRVPLRWGQLGAHGRSVSRPEWTGDTESQGGRTLTADHSWAGLLGASVERGRTTGRPLAEGRLDELGDVLAVTAVAVEPMEEVLGEPVNQPGADAFTATLIQSALSNSICIRGDACSAPSVRPDTPHRCCGNRVPLRHAKPGTRPRGGGGGGLPRQPDSTSNGLASSEQGLQWGGVSRAWTVRTADALWSSRGTGLG